MFQTPVIFVQICLWTFYFRGLHLLLSKTFSFISKAQWTTTFFYFLQWMKFRIKASSFLCRNILKIRNSSSGIQDLFKLGFKLKNDNNQNIQNIFWKIVFWIWPNRFFVAFFFSFYKTFLKNYVKPRNRKILNLTNYLSFFPSSALSNKTE
jgi:hypothetical protein